MNETFTAKVWYGSRDPSPVESPEFATFGEANRWIHQQPSRGRYRARRRSNINRNGFLYQIMEAP